MKLAEREQQILRVKSQSFQSEITSELENTLRTEVTGVIKALTFHGKSQNPWLEAEGRGHPRRRLSQDFNF